MDYWDRLKKLDLLSLQRQRERYILIHMWIVEDGKRPCSKWHQDGIQGKHLTWHKSHSPTTEQQIATISGHSLQEFLWSECSETMEPLPRQVNSLTALGPFKVSLARFLEMFPDTPPTKGYTAIINNSQKFEPGMNWGRNSYCCPEAIPAKPT